MSKTTIFESIFGKSAEKQIQDQLFSLKMTSKSLVRESKKCEKAEKQQKSQLKKAIKMGNMEVARVYANNAIREKAQALNFIKLASRMDAVHARVNAAARQGALQKSMSGVVKGLDSVMKTMDVEKISKTMDKFEEQFKDLDVTSAFMETAIDSSTSTMTPEADINELIERTAEEEGVKIEGMLDEIGPVGTSTSVPEPEKAAVASPADSLEARLAALGKDH